MDFFESGTAELLIKQVEAAAIPSVMLDLAGNIRYSNAAAQSAAPGFAKRDGVAGVVSADQLSAGLAKAAAGEGFSFATTPLGGQTVIFRGTPLYDGETPCGALLTFAPGVSDPQSLPQLLGDAGAISLESSFRRILSELFANLTIINRRQEAAGDHQLDPYMDNLNQLAYRILRNTSNMMSAMRFCTGNEPAKNICDFWAEAAELLAAATTLLHPIGVTLRYTLPKENDCVFCHFSSVASAIVNILANAARACGRSGFIDVSGKSLSAGVLLTIRDNGNGIAPEQMDKIFTPYYAGFDDGKDEGVGLGLSVARQILDSCGGTVTVQSERGEGTTFALTLPRCAPPAEDALPLSASTTDYLRDRFSPVYVGLCEIAMPPEQ